MKNKRRKTLGRGISLRCINRHERVYRHTYAWGKALWTFGRYRETGYLRCKRCKRAFWKENESGTYQGFCNGCHGFLYRLENPTELEEIRNADYGDIPF